ncbi:MAG: DUF2891 domain-containing protein [Labilithrix sp.]|nr:DUF2891 domain-containing protein [Labilithrix sp.]MCW5816208.1 DUF2891 domain-containing protein [Labilithrix sp.]
MPTLDSALAARFANIALGHVTREYPNKLDHVMSGEGDVRGPRALHPVFYGSFDWHSCVHSYWLLTRLCREYELPAGVAERLRATVNAHFTPENVRGELDYLARPASRGFERPYGWAWLLALGAELRRGTTDEARRWSSALGPLEEAFAARFREHLPRATYPIRAGTHANSAFAIVLALDWARVAGDGALASLLVERATAWFGADADCPAWEPGGDDFLSPALVEAECMRHVLGDAFAPWLDRFLPRLSAGEPKTLFTPATVSDRTDGKIAHLDGLNLSRAWCLRGLARAAPRHAERLESAAEAHVAVSLPHLAEDYAGEHWLATYAVLALT